MWPSRHKDVVGLAEGKATRMPPPWSGSLTWCVRCAYAGQDNPCARGAGPRGTGFCKGWVTPAYPARTESRCRGSGCGSAGQASGSNRGGQVQQLAEDVLRGSGYAWRAITCWPVSVALHGRLEPQWSAS